MSQTHQSAQEDGPVFYEIRLQGHLEARWAVWFEGLTITQEVHGETRLAGLVADQAALHGLLRKVRDLGLPLVAVLRIEINSGTSHPRSNQE